MTQPTQSEIDEVCRLFEEIITETEIEHGAVFKYRLKKIENLRSILAATNQPTCVTVDELSKKLQNDAIPIWIEELYPNGLKIIPNKQGYGE